MTVLDHEKWFSFYFNPECSRSRCKASAGDRWDDVVRKVVPLAKNVVITLLSLQLVVSSLLLLTVSCYQPNSTPHRPPNPQVVPLILMPQGSHPGCKLESPGGLLKAPLPGPPSRPIKSESLERSLDILLLKSHPAILLCSQWCPPVGKKKHFLGICCWPGLELRWPGETIHILWKSICNSMECDETFLAGLLKEQMEQWCENAR